MTPKREIYVLVDKRMPEDSDYEKSYATLNHRSDTAKEPAPSWITRIVRWFGVEAMEENRQSGNFPRFSATDHDESSGFFSSPYNASSEPDEHPSRPAA